MNATPLPCELTAVADMGQSLAIGARAGVVDLADDRSVEAHLGAAYFNKNDVARLAEAAVDRARELLQLVTRAAASAAPAQGAALLLFISAWVVAYVGVCPA